MSRPDSLLIGLDLGTTAIKCAVFDRDGTPLAEVTREYELLSPTASIVEVAPETYWKAFVEAIGELVQSPAVTASRIAAIGISAQGETLLAVDRDGEPLRNAIVWLDNRATAESAELADRFGNEAIYEVTGQPEMLATWPAAKVLWLQRNEPRTIESAHKVLLLEDYFIARMTGEYVCEGSLVTSTCYWDFRNKRWWPEMLAALGLGADQLPALVEPGTAIGTLRPDVAAELGLPASTVVCTGALDQACGAIGAGSVRAGSFSENTGAAVALCATLDAPRLDPAGQMPCHYHGVPDTYMFHTFTSGGIVLRWFRDQFAADELERAGGDGKGAYELMSTAAASVRPGADGLLMLPHLQGAMAPESNAEARGVLVGLTLHHGRAHVVRAIMESIAFIVRRNVEVLEGLGVEIEEVRALGGGSRSALWKQIEADVIQRPVATTSQADAATLGAAVLAGTGLGWYDRADEAADSMVQIEHVYEPQPEHAGVYDEMYGAYKASYDALCPVFASLAHAAG